MAETPQLTGKQKAGAAIAAGSVLIAALGPIAAEQLNGALDRWEGNRNAAYRDSIGIPTICRGLTRIVDKDGTYRSVRMGDRLTDAECATQNDRETWDHLEGALKAVPALQRGCPFADRTSTDCRYPNQVAAVGSLALNIGVPAFTRSTVARHYNAGRWRQACDAFLAWKRAGGQVVRGLVNRRLWERSELCLQGIPAEFDQ